MYQQPPARLLLRFAALVLSLALVSEGWGQAQGSGQNRLSHTAPSSLDASTQGPAQPASKRTRLSPPALRPLRLGSVAVGGSLRMRAEAWDWFAGGTENTYGLFPKLNLRSEAHALRLAGVRALWSENGDAYQPHTFGDTARSGYGKPGLGNHRDLGANYAISPQWAAWVHSGKIQGKGVMQSLYPQNPNALFGYSELTLKF